MPTTYSAYLQRSAGGPIYLSDLVSNSVQFGFQANSSSWPWGPFYSPDLNAKATQQLLPIAKHTFQPHTTKNS